MIIRQLQTCELNIELPDLPDYKFFCFDGQVKGLFVAIERNKEGEDVKFDFFDADFNHLPLKQGHENANPYPSKPHNFELMKQAAAKLSKGYPQVRVDLYDLGDKVLFGELTLYHFGGMVPFRPEEWDKVFGDMLTLPGEKRCGVIIRQLQTGKLKIELPDLPDYKFFRFNGEVKMLYVATERHKAGGEAKFDFFDSDFNHIPVQQKGHPNAKLNPPKPIWFEQMKCLAEKLSQGIPHVRIDFYETRNKVYFGEMTFYSMGGLTPFSPNKWDYIFGQWLDLPIKS